MDLLIDTTMRRRINSMTTQELYVYVWELYNKYKNVNR